MSNQQADITNWRETPFSHWAFQHIDQVLPTAVIPRGQTVRPLPERPVDLSAFRLRLKGGVETDLTGFLKATVTDALIVVKDGAVVVERYDNGMTASTRHIAMSATKSVTGLIAGILAGQGALDVDAPVTDLVPETCLSGYAGARIRDLLDMRADPGFSEAELKAYAVATGWEPRGAGDLKAFFSDSHGAPRDQSGPFRYISANVDLLGWAIERAGGASFADLVSRLLWAPMGAEQDALITLDSAGAARATGGMAATARDLARLGLLMAEGGAWKGRQIIPPAWLDDIASNGDRDAWKHGEFAGGFRGFDMRYRSNWYVVDSAPPMIFAMGIYGQNLFVDRANRTAIVKLSTHAEPSNLALVALTLAGVQEIRRLLAAL